MRKLSGKFLIVFSLCMLAIAGIVWACADSGEGDYSAFTPEIFVSKQYAPFFYDGYTSYYENTNYNIANDDANTRYNDVIVNEWYEHYNHQLAKESLAFLLLKASAGGVDSVARYLTGALKAMPPKYSVMHTGTLTKVELAGFFSYLKLARACEQYSVYEQYFGYDKIKPAIAPARLEGVLLTAFDKEADAFIKQRLWFQAVRYYYNSDKEVAFAKTVTVFNKYRGQFPKNITWYRTMAYVAGYYYHKKNYAQANYMYSLCYDYSYEMKIPSKWSFHPQEEKDWNATLKLAKTADEKITLWHMLGLQFDEERAIRQIVAISPKSDKLDLLLSRVINIVEANHLDNMYSVPDKSKTGLKGALKLVDSIALKNNTAKPYYWNLAAGYLHFLDSSYTAAGKFYASAKKQFPAGDKMLAAQGKLLDLWLYVNRLKKIDAKNEAELTEPLHWLIDTSKGLPNNYLRTGVVLVACRHKLAVLYAKQGDPVKQICLNGAESTALDSTQIQKLVNLLNKPNKTPFEKVMVSYYPHTVEQVYYHQALLLTYKEEFGQSIAILQKRKKVKDDVLQGNPFNSRLNDCHDCDFEAPQKQKFTPLSFIQTMKNIKDEITAGKDVYRNAYLLANAFYNATYYGNARQFYETDYTGIADPDTTLSHNYIFNMATAAKYYQLARNNAATAEQKARCTFMLAKCEHNEYYNGKYASMGSWDRYYNEVPRPSENQYFDELKKYANTAYYKEVLQECGYFRDYLKAK
jgi:hypothetical protein